MKLMIEQDEDKPTVTVTTDGEELDVSTAIMMIELAKLSIMSYYLGGDVQPVPTDEDVMFP